MRPKLLCVFTTVSLMTILLGGLSQPSRSSAQGTDFTAIAASQNQFAFDFYQQIRDDSDVNLIFSGYSIWQALAMVYAGARGNTESQMATALHYDLPQSELHSMIAGLNADIASRSIPPANPIKEPLQLNIANSVWGQDNLPFDQAFLDILAQQYQSEMHTADFINGSLSDITDEINKWVAEQTQDKITDILSPDTINTDTRLVLANAIYFKGSWANSFVDTDTQDAPFYLKDGGEITVPMMFQHYGLPYVTADNFEAITIPYFGDTAAMMLILPAEGSFDAVEQGFDFAVFDALREQLEASGALLNLYFPRFEFDTSFDLSPVLMALGMTDGFDPCVADFSGIVSLPDRACDNNLFISSARHKAYMKVDEEGTEAAAVTVVVEGLFTGSMPTPDPIEIRFDRPFLYAIYDKPTGTILFMGRVMNPAE